MPPPIHSSMNGVEENSGDAHPALHPSITSIPVTPGIDAFDGSDVAESPDIETPTQETQSTGPQWNANTYFAPREDTKAPDSPTQFASGARSPADLLRRLSLIDGNRPAIPDVDPRESHPGLHLSGGIISATFCIPHSVGFKSGATWVRTLLVWHEGRRTLIVLGTQIPPWYFCSFRFFCLPIVCSSSLEPYAGRLDRRDKAH